MKNETEKSIIYHTQITVKTICNNGSERYGATASCKFGTDPNGKLFEINKGGMTIALAIQNLKDLLSKGVDEVIEII